MKRALLFIFMTVCVLGMSACSSKDAMPETSDSASNPVQNTDISNLNGGKIWSEQDIVSMFSLVQETDWEYIECVLIPDHASDRVVQYSSGTIRSKQAMLRSLMQTDTFNSMAHMQECLTNLIFSISEVVR